MLKDNFQKHFNYVRELVNLSHTVQTIQMKGMKEMKLQWRQKNFQNEREDILNPAFGCPQCKRCKIVQKAVKQTRI